MSIPDIFTEQRTRDCPEVRDLILYCFLSYFLLPFKQETHVENILAVIWRTKTNRRSPTPYTVSPNWFNLAFHRTLNECGGQGDGPFFYSVRQGVGQSISLSASQPASQSVSQCKSIILSRSKSDRQPSVCLFVSHQSSQSVKVTQWASKSAS